MSTLLLRLAGPMQSWGTQSRFTRRDTGREPSKSGVVGLLCAALGRPRTEPVGDLAALVMGVRVDGEGVLEEDYQTAGGTHLRGERYGVVTAEGRPGGTVVSRRQYLAGADFLVGLEGDRALLEEVDAALAEPVWQLFLGRKGYAPGLPVRLPDQPPWGPGLTDAPLREALRGYPWPPRRVDPVRFVWEAQSGATGDVRADVPLSFALGRRAFATRYVETQFLTRAEAGQ